MPRSSIRRLRVEIAVDQRHEQLADGQDRDAFTLVLHVGVQNGSQPLLIAYGTATYASSVEVTLS